MFTLNNLILKLQEFQQNHKILKSWYFNDPYDAPKDSENISYPMMFGLIQPSILGDNIDYTVIRIYISDKVKKDKSNEAEVLSDTKLLAKDLLSYLKSTRWIEPLIVKQDVTLNHYVESFDDEVSGCWFDLTIKTAFEWDLCSVPVTGQPSQTNPYSSYIIDQNANIIATLSPGQYYTVEVLQAIMQTLIDPPPSTIIQTLT